MIPAAGQGILAVQGRAGEDTGFLADFNDPVAEAHMQSAPLSGIWTAAAVTRSQRMRFRMSDMARCVCSDFSTMRRAEAPSRRRRPAV